jgi:hypothetical protein
MLMDALEHFGLLSHYNEGGGEILICKEDLLKITQYFGIPEIRHRYTAESLIITGEIIQQIGIDMRGKDYVEYRCF